MLLIDHPFVLIFVSSVVGFFLKFAWDRWFAQSSRVTRNEFVEAVNAWRQECELRRAACVSVRTSNKDLFLRRFDELDQCRTACTKEREVEEELILRRRAETRRALVLIMMTQIKICEALHLDCSDVARMLVDMGEIT